MNTGACDKQVVTTVHEELHVHKESIRQGGYRISKAIETREVLVDEPLMSEEYSIERKPIEKEISGSDRPTVRYEGDTMIVPVVEEVLVVERRLMLKEELHIARRRTQTREQQSVELRSERVLIERIDAEGRVIEDKSEEKT